MPAKEPAIKPEQSPPNDTNWWRKAGQAAVLILRVLAAAVTLVVAVLKGCGPT
jgi:hypothetical protein